MYKNSEIQYVAFVLGYDLLNNMINKSGNAECDIAYDFCMDKSKEFINTEYYKNEKYSTYEMLEKWVNYNRDRIQSEFLCYTGLENKVIIENGFRKEEPIALVEKSFGDDKEYIIAFHYKLTDKKLDWGYGYYYSNKDQAIKDYEKVINGGNLADRSNKEKER